MYTNFQHHLQEELKQIESAGLYKRERIIVSPQTSGIQVAAEGKPADVINFCANNYLGLADNPELIAAAKDCMDRRGYGMASVRFICGTQDTHKQLERAISEFFGTEDTILYASCFDANGGLFEPLLTADDAIISDALNHAIWLISSASSKPHKLSVSASSLPTVYSPWTAMSARSTGSTNLRRSTTRWSWSMRATPPASSDAQVTA